MKMCSSHETQRGSKAASPALAGPGRLFRSNLLDPSRTPAQIFIKAPAFRLLPPDWLLLCQGLFKEAFRPLPVEFHLLLVRAVFHGKENT